MDIKTNIVDNLDLPTGPAKQIWHIADELPREKDKISQSSAYCFFNNKIAIVKNKDNFWAIPGGHLEKGEEPRDTVIREVLEEACVKIKKPRLLGYQEIIKSNGSKIYQLRWCAMIEQVLPFKSDFEIEEVKFIDPNLTGDYIAWWSKANGGKAELDAAKKVLKDLQKNINE